MGLIQSRKCKPVVLVSKRSFFFANLLVVKVFRIVTQSFGYLRNQRSHFLYLLPIKSMPYTSFLRLKCKLESP